MSSVPILLALIICFVLFVLAPGVVVLIILLNIRKRKRQNKNPDTRTQTAVIQKSLGEVLKAHRTACKMTQEFVAEHMGVSRQTVSKWETGINEPSTSNLLQLAKLFGVPAEELLNEISF